MMKLIIFGFMLYSFSMLLMMFSLYFLYYKYSLIFEWYIYDFDSMSFSVLILIDNTTLIFLMIVSLISSLVMFYSVQYMNLSDLNVQRFYYLVMLFIFSMYFMILSPSILSIILGWDGLGLISFCLIVYYQNYKSMSSGMLTMILNRIGDASLLVMMGFMSMFGSWNLMLYKMDYYLLFLLILMVFTKSAQMPFSLWLPAAMMAPTPISSLVHSSTLVTAGVYMVFRYIDYMDDSVKMNLMLISSFTMLMSGLYANFEIDLKKIVALSTLSQLGFMMSVLMMNLKDLAFLHLYIHAMFKSLMFMCVGSFMHYNYSVQDIRDYSNMMNIYPMKSLIMVFTTLSLMGFPFLLGFYSKDLIMEEFMFLSLNILNLMNLLFGTIFTVSYSVRLMLLLFLNKSIKFKFNSYMEDNLMNLVMFKLMLLSFIYSKFYFMIMISFRNINLELGLKLLVLKMFIVGIYLGLLGYHNYYFLLNKLGMVFKTMNYLSYFFSLLYLFSFEYILEYEMTLEKAFMVLMFNETYIILLKSIKFDFNYFNYYELMMVIIYLFFIVIGFYFI